MGMLSAPLSNIDNLGIIVDKIKNFFVDQAVMQADFTFLQGCFCRYSDIVKRTYPEPAKITGGLKSLRSSIKRLSFSLNEIQSFPWPSGVSSALSGMTSVTLSAIPSLLIAASAVIIRSYSPLSSFSILVLISPLIDFNLPSGNLSREYFSLRSLLTPITGFSGRSDIFTPF